MTVNPSIAKITRPKITGVLARERLFRQIDAGRDRPAIGITGPAGSGKTTLVASYIESRKLPCLWYQMDEGDADPASFFYYLGIAGRAAAPRKRNPLPLLTPEYLYGISTFTKRYFEDLANRVEPPFALVFDNYQAVPEASVLHEAIREGIGAIPAGMVVILISRHDPPPVMTRLRANNAMTVIGWEDIRFTTEEAHGVISLYTKKDVDSETVNALHARTDGWAAGLILLAGSEREGERSGGAGRKLLSDDISDYFATEIFETLDSDTRDFLLQTSFMPVVTVAAAERLTDQENAEQILSRLSRNHFFTVQHTTDEPIFEYHPLFREFLQARMMTALKPEGLQRVLKRAASLMEELGRTEDAISLYERSSDWGNLARLVTDIAPSLITQGRNRTVLHWVSSAPENIRQEQPWLLYWLGAAEMPFDLGRSRRDFEAAYDLFRSRNDAAGSYLSWCGIVDTYIFEWGNFMPLDRWIAEMDVLLQRYPEFPTPQIEARVTYIMFCALMYRQPHHPELPKWLAKAQQIALSGTNVHFRVLISNHLVIYYTLWIGERENSALLISALGPAAQSEHIDPLTRIVWQISKAVHAWKTADSTACLSAVKEGLLIAERTGIHILDYMLLTQAFFEAMISEKLEAAQGHLRNMAFITRTTRRLDIALYHYQLGWASLVSGDVQSAHEQMKTAVSIARETGAPFLVGLLLMGLAEILVELGKHDDALNYLHEARDLGHRMGSRTLDVHHVKISTLLGMAGGERAGAESNLRKYLAYSRESGMLNHAFWRPDLMKKLYRIALDAGIEVEHVRKLIRLHDIIPSEKESRSDAWPWPLKFFTLGDFRIEKDDQPLVFSGKVQKKPLELLKALISFGGRNVPEDELVDAVWPDADGDQGHRSFETTLYRLRQLLGRDDALLLADGKLSLDERFCWVDIMPFERMADEIEAAEKNGRGSREGTRTDEFERMLRCYRGYFLPADAKLAFTINARERLSARYRRLVVARGKALEEQGAWKDASELYHRGLEIDNLAEEFYQSLMLCLIRLGQEAEAIRTYERCCAALSSSMGLAPSARTQEVYQLITEKQKNKEQ